MSSRQKEERIFWIIRRLMSLESTVWSTKHFRQGLTTRVRRITLYSTMVIPCNHGYIFFDRI